MTCICYEKRPPVGRPAFSSHRFKRSDRWIPGRRDQAVLRTVLLDMADAGKGEVEADDRRLLRRRHVVELMTGLLREFGLGVVHHMPIRIAQEEFRDVGYVGLDQDFRMP